MGPRQHLVSGLHRLGPYTPLARCTTHCPSAWGRQQWRQLRRCRRYGAAVLVWRVPAPDLRVPRLRPRADLLRGLCRAAACGARESGSAYLRPVAQRQTPRRRACKSLAPTTARARRRVSPPRGAARARRRGGRNSHGSGSTSPARLFTIGLLTVGRANGARPRAPQRPAHPDLGGEPWIPGRRRCRSPRGW